MAERQKKLIIVESPAKAKTIAKFLGKDYKVEASQGHVRDLPKSQLGVDIDDDFNMKYITIRGRGDILSRIRKEAKSASSVLLATDPDREGEAISWHLCQILGEDPAHVKRVEFHEITSDAVKKAVKSPRTIDQGLVDAQQARRALDRLVGYKISPLLWQKVRKGLSAGRVQSVATRMVVDREEEIETFIPEEYWEIFAKAVHGKTSFKVRLNTLNGVKAAITNEKDAKSAVRKIQKAEFVVSNYKSGEKKKNPAAPFTTSSLQQEASRKLNFSTAKTMQIVQMLYEGVELKGSGTQGLVTYIRTDSVRISDEAMSAIRSFIPTQYGPEYLPETPNAYAGRKNAQDAHEAIRPTDVTRTPESIKESLTKDQYSLYRLIYNRFVASQMKPAIYETLTMDLVAKNIGLRFSGERKIFAGFTSIYEEGTDETDAPPISKLPAVKNGDMFHVDDVNAEQHFTQPPSRYTEASLVQALEEKGIGRPSTYAPTITTILTRGYVSKEKKRIYPTELGRMVNTMMKEYFPAIVDTEFTADLEDRLDKVAEGGMDWKQILRDFYPAFAEELASAEEQIEKVKIQDDVSDVPCEQCGTLMVYKNGRYGRFLACPRFPECRFTKPILNYIQAPCPKCSGRLLERTSRQNRRYYGCEHYPECDFMSWDKPVAEKCPQCGSYMTERHDRKGNLVYLCAGETCRYRMNVETVEESDGEKE